MSTMKKLSITLASLLAISAVAHAAPLYVNDFEADTSGSWTTNIGPATTDGVADFFFDYTTAGVPQAPNSVGTSQRGLKLIANTSSGVFGGISVSPTGQDFGSNYVLAFDWWSNFNGPAPIGGSGSTQLSTYGVGTSGTVSQWPGGVQDSVWFGATADGNSSSDWRAYSPAAATSYTAASGVYAAGTGTSPDARNQSHPYYASFGGVEAPAAQVLLYPQQTGTTLVGSSAFEWHRVEIRKLGSDVSWYVDGLLIATVPVSADGVLTGENIFFGHADTNATSSTDPNDAALLFTLIDNVVVVVPEPASLSTLALGGLLMARRRK